MELGAAFKPCFDIRRRVPCNLFNLKFRAADFRDTSTAEAGTLQLEFRDLSRSSKVRFYEVCLHVCVDVSVLFLYFYMIPQP